SPTNIGHLVRNEVKSCVALSGKEIAFNFCGIKMGKGQASRLLAVAADGQKIAQLADACSRAGLNAEVIEPPLLAYVRALHANKIEGKFDTNVLVAILRDDVLTLCVFRRQTLDFVGTRDVNKDKAESDELCHWLVEEINSIIRFYDVEATDKFEKWNVTVIADSALLPDNAEQSLGAGITNASLEVRTSETACRDTLVVQGSGAENTSVVAIGLAMRFLNVNSIGLKIDLLPPESAEVKSTKRHLLVTANIIGIILVLMALVAGGLGLMAKSVNQAITNKKQTGLSQNTYSFIRELESLDRQIGSLSRIPVQLKDILNSRYDVGWAEILENVRKLTPRTLRITSLYHNGDNKMKLEGHALSYEAVHLFVKMLDKSDYISSVSLTETVKKEEVGGLVVYTIDCSLAQGKKSG
ncbi:MAG: PilN domain-containing protein, partial [Phycisphaerales bacterium]